MAGKKRTKQESRSLKGKIMELKKQDKLNVEIARELSVTRQYVSLVLTQAGLGGRRRRTGEVRTRETSADAKAAIGRLRQRGERGLAEKLREVLDRKGKVKKRDG